MTQVYFTLAIDLLWLAFVAGGVYVVVKQTRRDTNGIGAKLGKLKEISDERYRRVCLAMMLLAPENQKSQIAELLRDK